MNVARLNMSHGDHASHQKVIDLVKEYNAQTKDNVIALMVDTKVCIHFFRAYVYILMDEHSRPQKMLYMRQS